MEGVKLVHPREELEYNDIVGARVLLVDHAFKAEGGIAGPRGPNGHVVGIEGEELGVVVDLWVFGADAPGDAGSEGGVSDVAGLLGVGEGVGEGVGRSGSASCDGGDGGVDGGFA